jgi:hypothetical protein
MAYDSLAAFLEELMRSFWLIGPDGKIVARDLRGEAIKEFVATSFGKSP